MCLDCLDSVFCHAKWSNLWTWGASLCGCSMEDWFMTVGLPTDFTLGQSQALGRWCIWVSHLLYKLQAKVSRSTFWAVMTRLLSQTSERFCMREQSKGKLNWKWKTSTIWNWCTDACKFTQFHTAWFVPTCHWAGQIQAPYATEECQDWKICSLTCKRNWGSSYNVSNWNNLQLLPLRAHQEAKNC